MCHHFHPPLLPGTLSRACAIPCGCAKPHVSCNRVVASCKCAALTSSQQCINNVAACFSQLFSCVHRLPSGSQQPMVHPFQSLGCQQHWQQHCLTAAASGCYCWLLGWVYYCQCLLFYVNCQTLSCCSSVGSANVPEPKSDKSDKGKVSGIPVVVLPVTVGSQKG